MHADQAHEADRRVHICIFLISLASLALEVLQMRIFAFSLWHHLAFLVVSIAILGFGAAGAFLSVAGFLRRRTLGRSLSVCGLLFLASAFAGPLLLAGTPIDVFSDVGWDEILRVGLYYLVFALPYFFAGYAISIAITQCPRQTSSLYFANMVGSGIGCFALYAVLEPLGAAGSLVAIASLGAVVAFLAPVGILLRGVSILAFAGCLSILPGLNEHVRPLVDPLIAKLPRLDKKDPATHPHRLLPADEIFSFKPAASKFINTYTEQGKQEILATRWSPLGRIDIVNDFTVGGEVKDGDVTRKEDGACLFQDGDAPGQMPHRNWKPPASQIHGISYIIKKEPKALIVGIGGGLDLSVAVDRGAKQVDAVEINDATLELYRTQFAELTGDLEKRDNFRLHHAEGRHFVRSSDEKFDLIQMSGVDTYTALANGAYVLSESYLYTKEAIHDYLDHLTDDGLLTIIRFAFPAPRETLRVLVIAAEVLRERGVANPMQHMALLINNEKDAANATRLGAIMLKKSPFSEVELDALDNFATTHGYSRSLIPGRAAVLPFDLFRDAVVADKLDEFVSSYPYAVHSVVDDRPFFFNQFRWSAVWDWLKDGEKQTLPPNSPWAAITSEFQKRPMGLMLLLLTFVQLAVLVAIAIFVPLFFLRRSLEGSSAMAPLGFFLCLGLAYIFLMISAMQRFGLILGHPTYSVTVVMATFLIGSGLGSLFSGVFKVRAASKLLFSVAILLVGAATALELYLPELSLWLLPQAFWIRCAVTVAVLAPMAFLMGICFPTGIRVLAEGRQRLIPWAYGVNGGASVLGSVITVALAMSIGFGKVQWVSAGLYVVAALLMVRMLRDARRAGERSLS